MNIIQSWWPRWLPRPSAWGEAVILGFLSAPLLTSLRFFGRMGLILTVAAENLGPIFLGITLGYILPFVAFAYVHSFLWSDPPKDWPRGLPAPRSIFEGFYALSVTTVALLVGSTVMFFIIDLDHPYTQEEIDIIAGMISIVTLITMAYLCQVKRWIWAGMRMPIPAQRANQKQSSSIDIELEKLRGQTGIHRVKKKGKENR